MILFGKDMKSWHDSRMKFNAQVQQYRFEHELYVAQLEFVLSRKLKS